MALDLGLRGRTAIVTGASEGIGRAIALRLAQEGVGVHAVARRQVQLDELAADARAAGGTVQGHALDLSASEGQQALFAACSAVDILVNNAGAIPGGTLLDIDEARWRAAWDLKLFGYINLSRHYYGAMKQRRSGVILNIVGNSGEKPRHDNIAGSVANAALMTFTRALGGNSLADGIRVLAINPGPTATQRIVKLVDGGKGPVFADMPAGRAATTDEIADLAAFLLSDRSGYTTGTVITADGGIANRGSFFS